WTKKVFEAPVIGRSSGMWNFDDARALLPNYNRRILAGLSLAVIVAVTGAWFAPELSNRGPAAAGAAAGWRLLAWFTFRGLRKSRGAAEQLLAERADLVTTVRESGVELASSRGISFYLWKGLARGPMTEEQIGLHVDQTDVFLVLAKRLFPAQDWRR